MKKINEHSKLVNIGKTTKITDPSRTFIKRDPNEDRIKVLIVPEYGKKKLVTVHLPSNYNCVVELLLVKLNHALAEEVEDIYLISNSINDVRYLVTLQSKHTFDKKVTKKKNFRDLTQGRSPKKKFHRNFFEFKNFRNNVEILLKYPLQPQKNEFIITTEDYKSLDERQFIKDIIIHFYLNYLTLDLLTSKNRKKINIFHTTFYTRWTTPQSWPPERRYEQVKPWTQNVNIFEKEFVFVPIHHCTNWLLAVICYPGLIGMTRFINTENENSTTVNRPYLLIFDSTIDLPKINKVEIADQLKSYLRHEYEVKTGRPNFFENEISVIYADVPKQQDPSDGGIYLLHFVESFFKEFLCNNKFSNFENAKFKQWCEVDIIDRKRKKLKRLLVRLAVRSQRCS